MIAQEWSTCTTGGCGNWGVPVPVTTEGTSVVFCGPCGVQITNITDIKPEEGTVLPQWILDQLATQNSGD